jgi:NAD(P)-dependent dehydrogenase (short-subunit alcohol dehydrogenase family)
MNITLNNKVAIVTGGTRGIGFAMIKAFVEADAKVVIWGSRIPTAEAALEKLKSLEFAGLKLPTVEHKCGSGDCGCGKPDAFTVKTKVNPDADTVIKAFLRNI